MTLEEFQASIEMEKAWREDDIRFYNNLQAKLDVSERNRLRRSIICMFYAHIEGFVYYSFLLYVESINNLGLKCKQVNPAIAAASLNEEFVALKNPDKKSALFKRVFPDDTKLHRSCREMDFVEQVFAIQNKIVRIPKKYIDTESNIGPDVLRKLLYQLGLDYNNSDLIRSDLNQLRIERNNIAHGKSQAGIEDGDYKRFKDCFYNIFSRLSNIIVMAYANKDYMIKDG